MITGFVQNAFICLPIGIVLMVGTLFVIKRVTAGQIEIKKLCGAAFYRLRLFVLSKRQAILFLTADICLEHIFVVV